MQINRPNNKLISNIKREVDYMYYDCECLSGGSGIVVTIPEQNKLTYFKNDNVWQEQMRKQYLHTDKIFPSSLTSVIKDSRFFLK